MTQQERNPQRYDPGQVGSREITPRSRSERVFVPIALGTAANPHPVIRYEGADRAIAQAPTEHTKRQ